MRILRIITRDAIQSLGSNTGFHADVTKFNGQPIEITMSKDLQCVKINNVLIPMSNIREIVLDDKLPKTTLPTVHVDVSEEEVAVKPSKKAKTV
jgi:vacuolar-type H+-ATPase subunit B/Vma2